MQLIVFFLILLTGYVYVWRKGVFNWGHEDRSAHHV
jgi:NADH:ubiquinone oxidoreductase subunit 3 (subunit A)